MNMIQCGFYVTLVRQLPSLVPYLIRKDNPANFYKLEAGKGFSFSNEFMKKIYGLNYLL